MKVGKSLWAWFLVFAVGLGGGAANVPGQDNAGGDAANQAQLADILSGATENAAFVPAATTDPILEGASDMLDVETRLSDEVDLRTFETPSLLLPAGHLFGEWGGLQPRLKDNGIEATVTWVSDMAGNPVGGLKQGFTECENTGINLLADLDKMYGMDNTQIHVSMSQRSGVSLSNEYIGNAFNVQQVFGGETFKLIDAEFIKRWCDGRISFHTGRMAAGDDFLSSPYYWFFMSNGICGNPVGIFKNAPGMTAYPNATWAARLRLRPTKRTYILAGVYNGDPTIRDNVDHGMDFSIRGPIFAIGEVGYQCNGRPGDTGKLGTYKAGIYYNGGTFTNFTSQVLGASAASFGLNAKDYDGNWGYYFLADQVVIRTSPVNYHGNEVKRGVGVFASFLMAPEQSINQMPFFCNGGAIWRGPFAARPTDAIGFAMIYGKFSDDLGYVQRLANTLDPSVAVQDYELVFEWAYRFRMRKNSLYFQPDLQYIVNPNGQRNIPNAFVVGCQTGINF